MIMAGVVLATIRISVSMVMMVASWTGGIGIILQPVFQKCLDGFIAGALYAAVERKSCLLQGFSCSRPHIATEENICSVIFKPLGQWFVADAIGGDNFAAGYGFIFHRIKFKCFRPPKMLEYAAVVISNGDNALCRHIHSSLN
jgi:hypothetical protein